MPNCGQLGGFRLSSRAHIALPAPSASVRRRIAAAASLSYLRKCEVCFAIAFQPRPAPEAPWPGRRLFRQTAQIIVACLCRDDQPGTAAVSASEVRAATIFCIIVINRFCSALLRPSSVS
jgi:hypothetical protein